MTRLVVAGTSTREARRGETLYMDVGRAPLRQAERDDDAACSTFAEVRSAVAPCFGCDADELVVTHSTTDSLCKIVAGLELHAGDEVVTTDQEHWGSLAPLALARDRHGVVIRRVLLPHGAGRRAEEYLERFATAVTHRTKVVLFSAPTFTTGAMLPIRLLARLAQERGAVCVVDGAHMIGMVRCGFRRLGVDFLAGSGSKWLGGPVGTALLLVRNKVVPRANPRPLPRFWPVVTVWYPTEGGLPPRATGDGPSYDIAEYLQAAGAASVTRMSDFQAACAQWTARGPEAAERHVLDLAAYLKEQIVERWGRASLYSPMDDPRLASGITAFDPFSDPRDALDEAKFAAFVERLEETYGIVARYTRFGVEDVAAPRHAVRVCTRLFHERSDVDRAVSAMAELARAMG